jgi:hypothetical protein
MSCEEDDARGPKGDPHYTRRAVIKSIHFRGPPKRDVSSKQVVTVGGVPPTNTDLNLLQRPPLLASRQLDWKYFADKQAGGTKSVMPPLLVS